MPVVTQTTARLGRAAGREGVGHGQVGDTDARLGHVGERAEPVDHAVQLGRLLRGHLAGAHGPHRDLVGAPPLPEGDADRDGRDRHGPAGAVDVGDDQRDEAHEQRPEQEHGEGHPGGQPGVLDEAGGGHESGDLSRG